MSNSEIVQSEHHEEETEFAIDTWFPLAVILFGLAFVTCLVTFSPTQ